MNASDKPVKQTGPMIVENYHDYTPPPKTRETVELLLSYVPPEYLVGLQSIVLSNIEAFSRKERKVRRWVAAGKFLCRKQGVGTRAHERKVFRPASG